MSFGTMDNVGDFVAACHRRNQTIEASMPATYNSTAHLENLIDPNMAILSIDDTYGGIDDMAKRLKERVLVGKDANGAPEYKWVDGKDKQELFAKIAKIVSEYSCIGANAQTFAPQPVAEAPMRLKPYAENWFKLYKEGKRRHTTLSEYRSLLRKHIYPAFGDTALKDISIDSVQIFFDARTRYACKTLREIRLLLGMILDAAKEDGLIRINPAKSKRIILASQKKTLKRNALPLEQVLDIIEHLDQLKERDKLYLALLLYTGTRRGETLAMRWHDIDFDKNLIHVQHAVTFNNNNPVVGTTKTDAGVRFVPLLNDLKIILLEARNALKESEFSDMFIVGGEKPLTETATTCTWKRIAKTINVFGSTPHYFRHTYITLAHRNGVDDKTLQIIGGYADIRTMQNVYMHAQQQDIAKAAEQMQGMFAS